MEEKLGIEAMIVMGEEGNENAKVISTYTYISIDLSIYHSVDRCDTTNAAAVGGRKV